jgi:hypothetical protein
MIISTYKSLLSELSKPSYESVRSAIIYWDSVTFLKTHSFLCFIDTEDMKAKVDAIFDV